jgi:hypothetical protein
VAAEDAALGDSRSGVGEDERVLPHPRHPNLDSFVLDATFLREETSLAIPLNRAAAREQH